MKIEKICGIYLWTNIVNNKKYVGCSLNIYSRWKQHINNTNRGLNRKFNNAIRKYGELSFSKEIIEICDSEKLKEREDYFIDFYDSIINGYNVEKGYNSITFHPRKKEICSNISEKAKQRKWINNGDENITASPEKLEEYLNNGWILGRLLFSNEHIKGLSDSHKGYIMTDETKKKCSWLGRNHSEQTKSAMSNKLKGRYSLYWYIDKYGEDIGTVKYNDHHNKSNLGKIGKIVINDGIHNKYIQKEELNNYLSNNWKKGSITAKNKTI